MGNVQRIFYSFTIILFSFSISHIPLRVCGFTAALEKENDKRRFAMIAHPFSPPVVVLRESYALLPI